MDYTLDDVWKRLTTVDTANANSLTSKLLAGVIKNPVPRDLISEFADAIADQYREWLDSPEGKDFYKS